jgi:diguanylate cyclase (GGDEF)-like protein
MRVVAVMHDDSMRQRVSLSLLSSAESSGIFHYTVFFEDSLASAEEFLKKSHADVLLVHTKGDVQESIDFCSKLRESESERRIGVIFVVDTMVTRQDAVSLLEAGADEFFESTIDSREILARVSAVLRMKAITDRLRSANHRLNILSQTDELTGLGNMRHFEKKFASAMTRCRDGQENLGVVMFDIDRFKRVNDTANHLAGSHLIAEVGKVLKRKELVGSHEFAARYGGDEFIILMKVNDAADLWQRCERIREAIESHPFRYEQQDFAITISLGGAFAHAGFAGSAEDVIKCADVLCYMSKEQGRNQSSCLDFCESTDLEAICDERILRRVVRHQKIA